MDSMPGPYTAKAATVKRRAQRRLRRDGKRISRSAFKTRKPQRGWVMTGEPRRWLQQQLHSR